MVTAISSSRCLSCLGAARRHLSPKHRELALQILRLCGSIQLLLLLFWIQDWWIQFPFEISFRLILLSCDLMICVQSCGMFCVCLCRVYLEFRMFLLLLVMRFVCTVIFSWRWNSLFPKVLERGCWPQSDDTGSLVWICELFFPQEDFN
jgi:hypothetical protein